MSTQEQKKEHFKFPKIKKYIELVCRKKKNKNKTKQNKSTTTKPGDLQEGDNKNTFWSQELFGNFEKCTPGN